MSVNYQSIAGKQLSNSLWGADRILRAGQTGKRRKEFTEEYYAQFVSDRSQLGNLYRDHSLLTFDSSQFQGAKNIIEKLVSLPLNIEHRISDIYAQPSSLDIGSILVMVSGAIVIDEQEPQVYSQVFHLMPEGGSYYIFNDLFQLNYS
ncbi:hypothetical protein V1515DRAFT_583242 [Lipomyces mesembrius]